MEFFGPQLLILKFVFLLISLYLYHFVFRSKSKPTTTTIGFKMYPLIGFLPELVTNRHRYLDWTTDVLSACPTNTSLFRAPRIRGILTANPLNVEHMLKTKFENYPKGNAFSAALLDFFGHGLFTSDGEPWKDQRKLSSYEFNRKSLRNLWMENIAADIRSRLAPLLESAAKTGRTLDMQHILHSFAFDNICKVVFNVDLGCLGDKKVGREFMHAFEEAAFLSFGRFRYALPILYKISKFFNVGSEKKLKQSIKVVHEFVEKQIKLAREDERSQKDGDDLLSRLFLADLNRNSADEFLRDNIVGFILAGGDTTSSALSWFLWLLSSRPEVENKILQELETIRLRKMKNIGDGYDVDDLREMHYLHAAISESMRLYPPVPVDARQCREDDIMPDGTFVGKNWIVQYNSYAMGRLENIWGRDCCEYKPERWLEDGIYRQESQFRFPIFHAGPRLCLGKDMAYIQMKSIVAHLLERFELNILLERGKSPEHLLSLTLRMKGGLPVTVKERFVK